MTEDQIKQLQMKPVPYSSVVGSGVMLLDSNGRAVGQIAILCHSDEVRTKEFQTTFSEILATLWNQEFHF